MHLSNLCYMPPKFNVVIVSHSFFTHMMTYLFMAGSHAM